jgi:hypothetical protein
MHSFCGNAVEKARPRPGNISVFSDIERTAQKIVKRAIFVFSTS